jgi:aminoglycoside phosphotransferase (APT) family kinase protein
VRKIGKTALFLRSDDGRRLVARVPRSGIAASRAACNYDALEAIRHDTVYGEWVRSVVPAPWWRGRVAGVSAFLEECRPGEPRQVTGRSIAWEPQALDFITRVHQASAAPVPLTGETYERLVGARVNAIVPHVPTEVGRGTLRHLTALLHERLHGRSLPLVRSHGDLTNENCLYDSSGRLVGVIDWELSQPRQLPLLDVIQSMDIAGESSRAPRWLRADLVFDAAIGEGPLRSAAEVQAYCEALGLQSGNVTPLLVMHWIDHVSARVQARCGDLLWMRRRVYQPLERLAAVIARW